MHTPPSGHQFKLDILPVEYTQFSLFDSNTQQNLSPYYRLVRDGRITGELQRRIRDVWETLSGAPITSPKEALDWFQASRSDQEELKRLLIPIFGFGYVEQLRLYDPTGYFTALTLITWARAVLDYVEIGPRPLFLEMNVLANMNGYNAGRIDALEITKVNGKALSPSTLKTLMRMSQSSWHFTSLEHFISTMRGIVDSSHVDVEVTDFKMCVGDGETFKTLSPEDIDPLPARHASQMRRYLIHLSMIQSLLLGREKKERRIWDEPQVGRFLYCFPGQISRPELTLSPEQQERAFNEDLIAEWSQAQGYAHERTMSLLIYRRVLQLIEAGRQAWRGPISEQNHLISQSELRGPVRAFVDQHRFKGPLNIFELEGFDRDKRPVYRLHINRLFIAFEKGLIKTRGFNRARGGHIACPIHNEEGPSLQVFVQEGRFYCHACKAKGSFAEETLPEELREIVEMSRTFQESRSYLWDGVIPDEHTRIMIRAQRILNEAFKGSPGEKYLSTERAIEPNLAFLNGAGFGSDALILSLIDGYGYDLDELRKYGFIKASPKVRPNSPLVVELKRRGIKNLDLPAFNKETGEPCMGLPFCTLRDRVTAPLEIGRKPVSFYGRTIHHNVQLKHFKLSREFTGLPYEGYNMIALTANTEEVFVAEAVIEAWTLKQMGHHAVIGMVGVHNPVLADALVKSKKKIAFALNIDRNNTGQNSTLKWIELLTARGVPREWIRNFTNQFALDHKGEVEEIVADKGNFDFNEWWKRFNVDRFHQLVRSTERLAALTQTACAL
ncbi:MAG TPA: CHC2 zinc finger domain-containing protein [Candidatus Paceibacterota bacterium]